MTDNLEYFFGWDDAGSGRVRQRIDYVRKDGLVYLSLAKYPSRAHCSIALTEFEFAEVVGCLKLYADHPTNEGSRVIPVLAPDNDADILESPFT